MQKTHKVSSAIHALVERLHDARFQIGDTRFHISASLGFLLSLVDEHCGKGGTVFWLDGGRCSFIRLVGDELTVRLDERLAAVGEHLMIRRMQ